MLPVTTTSLQFLSLLCVALVAGTMFGIWRGYDVAGYAPGTFVEVHQGAVRGLNTLLPLIALVSLAGMIILAILARSRGGPLSLYIVAALAIAASGIITRVINQLINDQIMGWTATTLPADWAAVRDKWWNWHLGRLATTVMAFLLLLAAVFMDRDTTGV